MTSWHSGFQFSFSFTWVFREDLHIMFLYAVKTGQLNDNFNIQYLLLTLRDS